MRIKLTYPYPAPAFISSIFGGEFEDRTRLAGFSDQCYDHTSSLSTFKLSCEWLRRSKDLLRLPTAQLVVTTLAKGFTHTTSAKLFGAG